MNQRSGSFGSIQRPWSSTCTLCAAFIGVLPPSFDTWSCVLEK